MHETNQIEFQSTMIPTEPLVFLYLQKCRYFVPFTMSTSNIMGQGFKYLMGASQTNSSTRIRDQLPSLVTLIDSQALKATLHKTYATSQWFNKWSTVSSLCRRIQHRPTREKPLLIRLSHVRIFPKAAVQIKNETSLDL